MKLNTIMTSMSATPRDREVVSSHQPAPNDPERLQLSLREQDVLDGLAKGLAYKQIADSLDLSISTVRTHIERIYKKLHVHNRTDAVVKFLSQS